VDSKRRLGELCRQIGVPSPEIYAVLTTHAALRRLPRLLPAHAEFVLKPDRGAAGRGILLIVGRQGDAFLRHNGQRLTEEDLRQHVSDILSGLFSLGGQPDHALLQRLVRPHPFLEQLSYQGTADVRILVYRGVPVMAMLRLPTRLSGGRANLHQGAVGVGVDLKHGVTLAAVLHNRLLQRHPDTDAPLLGLQVPCWPQMLDLACRVSQATGLGYVGVDLVLDRERGPQVLEANARPGLSIQIANRCGLLPRLAAVERLRAETPAEEPPCGA
jgi:alpha-L-glutamate ligase-like protein